MACDDCGCEKKGNILPEVIFLRVRELVEHDCTDEALMAAIQKASDEYNAKEQKKYMAMLRAELWAQEK